MLERLEHSMSTICDAAEEPSVIRIAAKAALLVIGKYYALTDDNEVYRIAIGASFFFFSLSWTNKSLKSNVSRKKGRLV